MGDLPMGLLGCPASFQRLMEKVLDGIRNPIVNIDDVIIHTATHQHHLQVLKHVLKKLDKHNLRIILTKCFFSNTEVAHLGFVLTPEDIRPGCEKLQVLQVPQGGPQVPPHFQSSSAIQQARRLHECLHMPNQ